MTATLLGPIDRPVQLTLDLRTATVRVSHAKEVRPYWQHIDNADLGGELHAKAPGVRAVLSAEPRADGLWVGYHDVLLAQSGSSGPTRPHDSRGDALVSAAYQLMAHCEAVLAQNGAAPRADATAARRLLRWVRQLDLV